MIEFAYSTEAVINASPQAVFDIVSNPANDVELAGSDEINSIRDVARPVEAGTHIDADETVRMADGSSMDLTATSIVVTYDPPQSFSLITIPNLPEQVRRIQWWFNMAPQAGATKVTHEVEIDFGNLLKNEMLIGLRDNYEQIRAGIVRTGMDKTLQNLKGMAGG